MFGHYTDLPTIGSFDEAQLHHDSITPIRGSNNLRPICLTANGRRKKHLCIERLGFKTGKRAIVCKLYDTAVLTFWEDGVIEYNSAGWNTNSTHKFASHIVPSMFFGSDHNLTRVSVREGHTLIKTYHLEKYETFRFRNVDSSYAGHSWRVINPKIPREYYLKRKVFNSKRKPLATFEAHCLAMAKLADPRDYASITMSSENCLLNEGDFFNRSKYQEMYKQMTDLSMGEWAWIITLLLLNSVERDPNPHDWNFSSADITNFITRIVKFAHFEEVFELKEVPERTFNGNIQYNGERTPPT